MRIQTDQENCVSHLPFPWWRRQAATSWCRPGYQGGASLIDFSDSRNPVETGLHDRGPISSTAPVLAAFGRPTGTTARPTARRSHTTSTVWGLTPTDQLSENEFDDLRYALPDLSDSFGRKHHR